MNGFVLANKPSGLSSHALVAELRKKTGIKRIGHTGTLDRFADGLMLLLLGRTTCLADFFLHCDKSYRALFSLGRSTDTHDPEGNTQLFWEPKQVKRAMKERENFLQEIILAWEKQREQIPPVYSALKKGGRRYSDLARMGKSELPQKRKIQIHSVAILEFNIDKMQISVEMEVSGGTYIRSFARDLAESSGIPLHLSALTRLSIGRFCLEGANLWEPQDTNSLPILGDATDLLLDWPRIFLPKDEAQKKRCKDDIRCGRFFDLPGLAALEASKEGMNFFIAEPCTSAEVHDRLASTNHYGLLQASKVRALAWAQKRAEGFVYKRIFI